MNPEAAFIATLGLERQVVTVTLDLLLARGERFGVVVVIHTDRHGDERMRASVDEVERELVAYVQADKIGGYELVELRHAIDAPSVGAIADIQTEADAGQVFNAIFRAVRRQKREHRRAVHLNVAGGRKGMTAYGMATAQLLFEEGDHLWLLVSSPQFIASRSLHLGSDAADTDAWLLEIPVLRYSSLPTTVTALLNYDDPMEAIRRQNRFVDRQAEAAKAYFLQSLPEEQRKLLEAKVRTNMSNKELAELLGKAEKTIANQFTVLYKRLADSGLLPEDALANHETLVKLFANYFRD